MSAADDPLHFYLAEVARVPPLDRAEELACIEHLKAGDALAEPSRKRLVEAHLHLVVTLAERRRTSRVEMLHMLEKGNEGLLKATRSLTDCPPGAFATHAATFIENALAETQTGPADL